MLSVKCKHFFKFSSAFSHISVYIFIKVGINLKKKIVCACIKALLFKRLFVIQKLSNIKIYKWINDHLIKMLKAFFILWFQNFGISRFDFDLNYNGFITYILIYIIKLIEYVNIIVTTLWLNYRIWFLEFFSYVFMFI